MTTIAHLQHPWPMLICIIPCIKSIIYRRLLTLQDSKSKKCKRMASVPPKIPFTVLKGVIALSSAPNVTSVDEIQCRVCRTQVAVTVGCWCYSVTSFCVSHLRMQLLLCLCDTCNMIQGKCIEKRKTGHLHGSPWQRASPAKSSSPFCPGS